MMCYSEIIAFIFLSMASIEEYLEHHPEQAQRVIGITWEQFQELVTHAERLHQQKQQARPRLIKSGGGRRRKLSVQQEILLTLVYLHQYPTFQILGIQFDVGESTAHDIFHYWVNILGETLPASLIEQFKKKESEWCWIEEELTKLELIVDSYQQPIQRP
jgi:Helix-turn-helix of DDE superfamily endonuclease